MIEGSYYDVMRHWLLIDGKPTKDFGVYLSGDGTFKAAEKNLEEFTIPGRNGTFHYSAPNTYKNVKVPYDCFIFKDFKRNVAALRSFLLSREGYVRIEDTHHPDEFRMGIYHEEFDPDVFDDLHAAQFTLNFDCRPERWLKSGEQPITYYTDGSIINPTNFIAKPLIRIHGPANLYGSMNFMGSTGQVTMINFQVPEEGYFYIDSELQEAYTYRVDGTPKSLNSTIEYANENVDRIMPDIKPGLNAVLMYPKDGSISMLITPRWWTL